MKNIDDFFGEDQSQNVYTLIEVTKKFFTFVSQLAEIVEELGKEYSELNSKVEQLLRKSVSPGAAVSPPLSPVSLGSPPPTSTAQNTASFIPSAPTTSPPGFPAPPSPLKASAPPPAPVNPLQAEISSAMQNRSSPPAAPSGLPPLPGTPSATPPGYGPPGGPPGFGQTGVPGPEGIPGAKPRMSPMNLKAQMNMELKEAFARIKKGWSEEDQ